MFPQSRIPRKYSVLSILIHVVLTAIVYTLLPLKGFLYFINKALVIASISAISSIFGSAVGSLSTLLSTFAVIYISLPELATPMEMISVFWSIFFKQIIVVGFVGTIVDKPNQPERMILWTFLSSIISYIVSSIISMTDLEYFVGVIIPLSSPTLISSALLAPLLAIMYGGIGFSLQKLSSRSNS